MKLVNFRTFRAINGIGTLKSGISRIRKAVKNLKPTLNKLNWVSIAQAIVIIAVAILPALVVLSTQIHSANAQGLINSFVNSCPRETGIRCTEGTLGAMFKLILNWGLLIAFIAAVIVLIYGGFVYITSAGNTETAGKGKQAVFNALIGLVIISFSFIIVQVVYRFITGSGGGAIGQ